jgi:hypothetical protein
MPLSLPATFYGYGQKNRRIALHTIKSQSNCPTDWHQLKMLVADAIRVAYFEHKLMAVSMTLESHLGGKFTDHNAGGARASKPGSYGDVRIHFKRSVEWFGKVSINTKTMAVKIDNCQFGPNLWLLADAYYEERGIRYRSPSIIPKKLPKPGDPKGLLMDPTPLRYVDYSQQPKDPYGAFMKEAINSQEYSYPSTHGGSYNPENLRLLEEKKKSMS